MKASHRWLAELAGVAASPEEMAERLTRAGLEVEELHRAPRVPDEVVVAQVRGKRAVAGKDRLTLVTVWDGEREHEVICGAPNVPDEAGRVLLARVGARLPNGMEIGEREIAGVVSRGMLCSETELAIGGADAGILVLDASCKGRPGARARDALELDDVIFEIGLTANRPDGLGHIGLAREVALLFGMRFQPPHPGFPTRVLAQGGDVPEEGRMRLLPVGESPADTLTLVDGIEGIPCEVPVRIEDPARCPRYAGAVVQRVRVGPSPFWLRRRLHLLGVRAINAVVDITNLVLFEHGHPMHAFDLERLAGPEIIVRLARAGERMSTLDGVARRLTEDDLLICDARGPVAVAGVMGGAESEIHEGTRAVLLECAYFDPRSVRRTSRRLGIHTDSSHRFERGVDPQGVDLAIRRAVSLMVSVAGGAAAPHAIDAVPRPIRRRAIVLDPARVAALLGAPVSEKESRAVLEGLGCSISPGELAGWRVLAPTWRPDLSRPEDLVEEVARIRGYDAIPSELPRIVPSGRGVAPELRAIRRLRETAAAVGLLEAVNFSFVARADLERAMVSTDAVAIANPISEQGAVMRTSLLPGLIADVVRARRHHEAVIRLFELARVYAPGDGAPAEVPRFAVVLAGTRRTFVADEGEHDLYDALGVIDSIVQGALGAAVVAHPLASPVAHLHPRKAARLTVEGVEVGTAGVLHPDAVLANELDVSPVVVDLDVRAAILGAAARGVPQAQPLPRFPAVARDVALVVAEARTAREVQDALREAGGPLAESVMLFDVYRGEHMEAGSKSLAFRIVYRDPEGTLTDPQVDEAHTAVVRAARERLGATVR